MNKSFTKPQLILCGSIAIDRIMNFNGYYKDLIQADKLHVLSLSVLLNKLEQSRGGVAANIAYSMALLGEHAVLFDSVGNDAKDYIADLAAAGVNTQFVHFSKLSTASFNVMTDLDDNQIGGFYPGAMADSESLSLMRWKGQNVLVCLSAHDPASMRSQAEECLANNIRMVFDPGQQVSNVPADDLRIGLEAAEVLIVNDYELGVLCEKTGQTASSIKSLVPLVITTYGKEGSEIAGKNQAESLPVPAAKPEQVVDPTGAGDAFRAGFLYGYLRQWELLRCGQLGSVVASFIIEQHGTQREFSKAQIAKRYKENFNEEITL